MLILVTGGAGYVGSVLVPALLADGHRVRVLDRLRAGGQGLLLCCAHPGFAFVHGDICDEPTIARSLDEVELIVHLAAIVGYPACQREPELAADTNVIGTKLLLELRRPDQKVLLASTGSVYGSVSDALCSEETVPSPVSLYASTKAEAEELVRDGGNTVVYRYATGFGVSPCMRFDLLPNDFVRQALHRGSLTIYQGGFRRSFIHVQDMARSVVFAVDRWKELADNVYNVGDERMNISKAQLAERISRHVDYRLYFDEFATDADKRDYAISYQKIRGTGFRPSVDLDRGIAEIVTAARLMRSGED
jgi:nucleoside-diphosphate-sugar epimerase